MDKTLHMTLAPKGGVGKSFIAALLAQWLVDTGQEPVLYDNDPATPTLKSYKGLPVQSLDLMRKYAIRTKAYDEMFSNMTNVGRVFLVDNGTSNWLALQEYIVESDLFEVLTDIGVQPIVHVPIIGANELANTLGGLDTIGSLVSDQTKIVVWNNQVKGEIEHAGLTLDKMLPYKRHMEKILGQITIPESDERRGDAIKLMLTKRATFNEIDLDEDFGMFEKSRLRKFRDAIYLQLNQIFGAPRTEDEAA